MLLGNQTRPTSLSSHWLLNNIIKKKKIKKKKSNSTSLGLLNIVALAIYTLYISIIIISHSPAYNDACVYTNVYRVVLHEVCTAMSTCTHYIHQCIGCNDICMYVLHTSMHGTYYIHRCMECTDICICAVCTYVVLMYHTLMYVVCTYVRTYIRASMYRPLYIPTNVHMDVSTSHTLMYVVCTYVHMDVSTSHALMYVVRTYVPCIDVYTHIRTYGRQHIPCIDVRSTHIRPMH